MIGIQNWMNNHYGNATTCMASVSRDRIRWHEVEVTDISTRGLKFHSKKDFNVGEILHYDLNVYSMLTAFQFGVEGCITEKETLSDGFNYSVEFCNLDKNTKFSWMKFLMPILLLKTNISLQVTGYIPLF